MPSRRAFIGLVEQTHGTPLDQEGKSIARWLWSAIKDACVLTRTSAIGNYSQRVDRAMRRANDSLRGFGIEYAAITAAGRGFEYVNMGDVYAATLIYDNETGRFHVTSYGDMVEELERRQQRSRRRRR